MTTHTLEELAWKHCHDLAEHTPSEYTIYEFTLDQLSDLIKEVVGEPVFIQSNHLAQAKYAPFHCLVCKQPMDGIHSTQLHTLKVTL